MSIDDAQIIVARIGVPGPSGVNIDPSEWTAAMASISTLGTTKADKSWTQHRVLASAVGPVEWDASPGWIISQLGLVDATANSTWMVRWMIGDYLSGDDADGLKWEVTAPSGTTLNMVAIGNVSNAPSDIEVSPIVAINTATAQEFLTGEEARGYTIIEGTVTLGSVAGSVYPALRTATGGSGYLYAGRSTLSAYRMS